MGYGPLPALPAGPPRTYSAVWSLRCLVKQQLEINSNILEKEVISTILERDFLRLDAWFHWFKTTQIGKDPISYFWHGRDNVTDWELKDRKSVV